MKHILKLLLVFTLALSSQQCALFSAAGLSSQGQPTKLVDGNLVRITPEQQIVDHSVWDELLKKHVDEDGLVNYRGFQKDQSSLRQYLIMLSETLPNESWPVEELLAYYINTYNAYTVQLILDNYPVESIKDINGPWTKGIVPIGNKNLSLGGIENGILRKMNEPRIHFAINCASISCPKLLNEAFVPSRMEEQLQRVTSEFINGNKNELNSGQPKLSSIFKWYQNDFKVDGKVDVIGYINQFTDDKMVPDADLGFKDYNWNLNEQ
ncbi:DUF547 domain-containing protein [Aureitalea sp. L0-47]|uniref:DUF547 domain-containing protein n=1 Tax=Aureitalea sp. L0-47 TaxID=2816962 RepID=UPI002238107A|nr:DUF547 domain-containing protein [Aureitalea sp. L0-47]MCW5518660.1 DUF547 domain-containing protein [Aureitalea sp. L0-47]